MKRNCQAGFTLPELLMATILMAVIFVGVLLAILKSIELSDIAKNSSTAVLAAKSKMAEIENTTFSQIYTTYNNVTFNVSGFNNAKGVTYINNSNPNILTITTVICWKQPNGRVFGEDKNLNGQLDAGEDKNGNGKLDSIVTLTTVKYG
jgi:prepilin-type N-terminal cleavage/methylation domain-containing protein